MNFFYVVLELLMSKIYLKRAWVYLKIIALADIPYRRVQQLHFYILGHRKGPGHGNAEKKFFSITENKDLFSFAN